jgi:hypothetical protein
LEVSFINVLLKIEKSNLKKINKVKVTEINVEENLVLNVFCNAILKTGKNIGCQCGSKVSQNGKCKRHMNTNVNK